MVLFLFFSFSLYYIFIFIFGLTASPSKAVRRFLSRPFLLLYFVCSFLLLLIRIILVYRETTSDCPRISIYQSSWKTNTNTNINRYHHQRTDKKMRPENHFKNIDNYRPTALTALSAHGRLSIYHYHRLTPSDCKRKFVCPVQFQAHRDAFPELLIQFL